MSVRVLIVDALGATTLGTTLGMRLTAEYLEVLTTASLAEAYLVCAGGGCDVAILDGQGQEIGADGLDFCRRMKRDPACAHIPVFVLGGAAGRALALEAGADDVATRPFDEMLLVARVRSLARGKQAVDELRARALASARLGSADPVLAAMRSEADPAGVLLIEDRASAARVMKTALEALGPVEVESDPRDALFRAAEGGFGLFVPSLGLQGHDGLRLCAQLRSLERTRQVPILAVADAGDRARVLRGLELGLDDVVSRPLGPDELAARARAVLRRRRLADRLRATVLATIEMAMVDTLTGLKNRRYFDANFATLVEKAACVGRPVSLMMLDIDHFKTVNDTYGHDAGDHVLKGFAGRVRAVVRGSDLFCRLGGEEFAIVMPDTDLETAEHVAERVRRVIEHQPFPLGEGQVPLRVTSSIGLAERHMGVTADELLRSADVALYDSKRNGRNRVTARAA